MWQANKWTVQRNSDFQMLVHLIDINTACPINISGASQINLMLKKSDGTTLIKAAYQGMACGLYDTLWLYAFLLTAAETGTLPLVDNMPIEVEVLWGSQVHKFAIQGSLTTVDPTI